MEERGVQLGIWNYMFAGIAGGAVIAIATNPIWVVKTRLQVQVKEKQTKAVPSTHYKGMLDAFMRIPREENFWALYKGLGPALLATSHGGVQFSIYEILAKFIQKTKQSDHLSGLESFFAGGMSKAVALVSTQPLSVVRSRLQEQRSYKGAKLEYGGFLDCIFKMYRNEGTLAFFKGIGPSLWRLTLSSACFFFLLEKSRGLLISLDLFKRVPHDSNRS